MYGLGIRPLRGSLPCAARRSQAAPAWIGPDSHRRRPRWSTDRCAQPGDPAPLTSPQECWKTHAWRSPTGRLSPVMFIYTTAGSAGFKIRMCDSPSPVILSAAKNLVSLGH